LTLLVRPIIIMRHGREKIRWAGEYSLPKKFFLPLGSRRSLLSAFGMVLCLFAFGVLFSPLEARCDCGQQTPLLNLDPSPLRVGETLHVRFQWCETDSVTLFIYNVSWSPALKKKWTTLPGANTLDLVLKGFVPGIYYTYLEIDEGSSKKRSSLKKFAVLR